jgi:integrase
MSLLADIGRMSAALVGNSFYPAVLSNPRRAGAATLDKLLAKRLRASVTAHGFRSAFRDWAGNETHFPREVAEAALAHVIGDAADRAYRRGDALEKRRALMEAWADFLEPSTRGNVVNLPARG